MNIENISMEKFYIWLFSLILFAIGIAYNSYYGYDIRNFIISLLGVVLSLKLLVGDDNES